jgi:hypothetical protein
MTFLERFGRPFKRHYGKLQLCKNKEKEEQEEWSSTELEGLSQVSTSRASSV